jgi:hypothetical protein
MDSAVAVLCCPFHGMCLHFCQPASDHAQNLYIGLVGIIEAGRVNKDNRVFVYRVDSFSFNTSNIRRERPQSVTDVWMTFSRG